MNIKRIGLIGGSGVGGGNGSTKIVNDLTTGGVDKALSAEQGKILNSTKQNTLTGGEFKTVNGSSIWGSGNIVITGGEGGSVEIVNDLTTGGADKVLSAEMGKELSAELTELEEKLAELGSEIGVIARKEFISNGTEIKSLLNFKGKKVYFNVSPTNINGAIYLRNGESILYEIIGEKYVVIPENTTDVLVLHGNVVATILYKDYRPSNIAVELKGGKTEIEGQAVNYAEGMYVDGNYEDGRYNTYPSISTAYYEVKEGITYNIHIPHCTNAAAWMIGYTPNPDSSVKVTILKEFGKGINNKNVNLVLYSTYTGYIALGYATGSELPTTRSIQEIPNLRDEVRRLSNLVDKGEKANRSIMFFGDSLTAASTKGIVGFAENIAKKDNVPYRAFIRDRFDTNPDIGDIDVDYPCYTNYAKDGTTNRIVSTRVDSVLERVKNHVKTTTKVDVVIVECCVNDYASTDTKGIVSDNYSGFDTSTTLGGLEETCRYLSTLNKNMVFGFIIPWNISWTSPEYFDDHIAVFKKWGVPFLDLRYSAGFEMRKCIEHRNLYSLPSSSYGNYDSSSTYNLDDKVKYNGYLYKCTENGVTGIDPTNEQYWIKVSDGSFDGTHLNTLGHYIVWNKIYDFINRL